MMTKTLRGLLAFTTIFATAACAFAGANYEKVLANVRWNQSSPWEDYLPSTVLGKSVPAACRRLTGS